MTTFDCGASVHCGNNLQQQPWCICRLIWPITKVMCNLQGDSFAASKCLRVDGELVSHSPRRRVRMLLCGRRLDQDSLSTDWRGGTGGLLCDDLIATLCVIESVSHFAPYVHYADAGIPETANHVMCPHLTITHLRQVCGRGERAQSFRSGSRLPQ